MSKIVADWERARADRLAADARQVTTEGVSGADSIAPLVTSGQAAEVQDSTLRVGAYISLGALEIVEPWRAVNFENGFENFSPDWHDCEFYKDPFGTVKLRGLFKRLSAALNTTVFTLPEGYRPSRFTMLGSTAGNQHVRVDIHPNGSLVVAVADSASWFNYVSLDNLSFDTR